jgi:hypothetical protein
MRSPLRDRLAGLSLFTAACAAVLVPDFTQRVADLVGVGRGTDLTFYLLAAGFTFFAVLIYSRLNRLSSALTELVRQLAVAEALVLRAANTPAAGKAPRAE